MSRQTTSTASRYALAVAVTALATLLRWAAPEVLGGTPFLAFYPAVVAAAAFWGAGPGLLATILSALIVDVLFMPPFGRLALQQPAEVVRLAFFLAGGIGISVVAGMKRSAQARERRQVRDLAELAKLTDLGNMLIRDEQDRIIRWSEGCARLYGFTAEEALGRVSHELLKTQFPQPLESIRATLRQTGRWEGELVHHRADGQTVIVASSWILRPGDGGPTAILEVNNDLTQQRRTEAALKQSEQSFREMADAMPQLAWIAGADGWIYWYNCRWYEYTGATPQQMEGWGWQSVHNPETLPAVLERWKASIATGEPFDMVFPLRGADGRFRSFLTRVQPLKDAEGRVVQWFGTNTDVDELKRVEEALRDSERKYRVVADHTHAWEFWLSPEGQFLYSSPSCQRITGYAAEAFAADPDLFGRIIHPEDRALYAEHRGSGHDACVTEEVEFRIIRRDGVVRWMNHTCAPIYDRDGHFLGIRGSNRDITDRKAAEEELKAARRSAERAKAAAEEASHAKDHFLAVLSHELRTPLTPVVAAVSMLQKQWRCDEASRELLEMVRRNVEMEARLIDDLLDVTRIVRGKIELNKETVPLREVIRRTVEVVQPDIEARQLHFGLDMGEAAPCFIHADAARLQQVFWNLLKNAIKFTPHGGCVGIRCHLDNHTVVTEVIDSGEGIDPAIIPDIFKPFEQGGPHVTRQFGGLGLGLTITRGLVEMHGGSISAHSEGKGKGATFRVRLPIHTTVEPSPPPAGLREIGGAEPASPARAKGASLRILLVEDHGDTARMIRQLLTLDGHSVERAGDVATALELAESRPFDLLLSDLGLPDGSGVELMQRLRQRGHALPGIALSGYGQEEDISRSKEAGFAAHLTKPISPEQVARAIASVTDRRNCANTA